MQYTERPGGAAARVTAAGAAAAFRVARAVHRASWTSCDACGRRWGRGCLSHGRRSTQSVLDQLRRAWPPLGRGCHSYHSSQLHLSHHNFSSQLITYQLITAPLLTPRSSQLHCSSQLITGPLLITSHRSTSHHNSSQLITSQLITLPLLTPHFLHLTYHITTSHHNSSPLITCQLITAPLLTPLLTPHFSHQNSSQLHFPHLTSQVHFSHLTSHTSPKFTLSLHKGLTCGVIRSFYLCFMSNHNLEGTEGFECSCFVFCQRDLSLENFCRSNFEICLFETRRCDLDKSYLMFTL